MFRLKIFYGLDGMKYSINKIPSFYFLWSLQTNNKLFDFFQPVLILYAILIHLKFI